MAGEMVVCLGSAPSRDTSPCTFYIVLNVIHPVTGLVVKHRGDSKPVLQGLVRYDFNMDAASADGKYVFCLEGSAPLEAYMIEAGLGA